MPSQPLTEPPPALAARLDPAERLLWWGRPCPRLAWQRRDMLLLPFAALWVGLLVVWMARAAAQHQAGPAGDWLSAGLPLFLIGLYILVGRFPAEAWARRRTLYAVTTRRALVLSPFARQALELVELGRCAIAREPGGRRSLMFGRNPLRQLQFGVKSGFMSRRPAGFSLLDAAEAEAALAAIHAGDGPDMKRLWSGAGLALCGALLALALWGRIDPPDYRGHFAEPLLSYDEALAQIDAAYAAEGATPAFVTAATGIYDSATAYDWPAGLARVSVRDNWILAVLSLADPLLRATGLKPDGALFGQFESFRYARALGRGFGICSQNALGFADLLQRRYGIAVRMAGLGGHVVTVVELPEGTMIADPSLGVTLPFGLDHAEAHVDDVREIYARRTDDRIWTRYDPPGNVLAPGLGSGSYAPPFWKLDLVETLERIADPAAVILPASGVLVFAWRLGRRRPRRGR